MDTILLLSYYEGRESHPITSQRSVGTPATNRGFLFAESILQFLLVPFKCALVYWFP